MKIKQWLKFFWLSFFSDKIAKQAPKFGFSNILLSLILAFFFFLFGYYGADVAPFSTHYKNAGQYRDFIYSAFAQTAVEIMDGKARSEAIINSYTSDGGYAKNGYNFIMDTRPSDTLIRFTQVAVKGEEEIPYEEYRAMGEKDREDYTVKTVYTDKELEITEELIVAYEEFLSETLSAKAEYQALNRGAEDYAERLYYLYVKYYFNSVSSVLQGAEAPVLRDFYYSNYISNGNSRYFYVFDNLCTGSFETDSGMAVVFGGYFDKCPDGMVTDIDGFIKDSFYNTAGYLATNYVVSTMSRVPLLVVIPLIFALVMWGMGKIIKDCWVNTFSGCYKTVNAFLWAAALLTALIVFLCGWFVPARYMYSLMPLIFAAVLLIRTAIFSIVSVVQRKKELARSGPEIQSNITV